VIRKSQIKILEVIAGLGTLCSAYGQTPRSVNQSATKSTCVNIVALSGAKVNCSNLTDAQKKAIANIPAILEMTLNNQNYLEAIIAKLNEIKNSPQGSTTLNAPNCPGGICPTGTTFGNQTVINTTPPSSIEGFEIVPSDPKVDSKGHPITSFRFYLSEPVADQKFIAICDRPCSALSADTSPRRGVFMSSDITTGQITDKPTWAAWVINYPIHAGQYQVFTVGSADSDPVNITKFAFGKFPIKPQ
jgi:hypothetical protein